MSRLHINEKYVFERLSSNESYHLEIADVSMNPANNMSNLEMNNKNYDICETDFTREMLSEPYGIDAHEPDPFPNSFKNKDKYQRKDSALIGKLKRTIDTAKDNGYHTESFRGGGTDIELICYNGKIVILLLLQKYVLHWYHTYLLHPGITRTEETIRQHFHWKNL